MRLALFAFVLAIAAFAGRASAMDGTNLDTGDSFTVDDATTFTEGDTLQLYDDDGNEIDVIINAVKDTGGAFDVDVTNPDTNDTATIEFTKP